VAVAPANSAPTGTAIVEAPSDGGGVLGAVIAADADSDTLSYTVSTPGKGAVTVNPDGTFTYTPSAQARHDAAADGAPAEIAISTLGGALALVLTAARAAARAHGGAGDASICFAR
jgi:hypothetical protein